MLIIETRGALMHFQFELGCIPFRVLFIVETSVVFILGALSVKVHICTG